MKSARPSQLPPAQDDTSRSGGNWHTWLLLAGRGFGKTRAGAEEFLWQLLSHPDWRGAIVAPTAADTRDTCVEGESGILSILPEPCLASWNRSLGEIILTNNSRIKLFSADAPERLRGPQHHIAWCDELGAWRYPEALDQLRFGLRLGETPRLIITTTPKPSPPIRDLLAKVGKGVVLSRGSTFENAANLAPAAMAELRARYEGTRLGRQELHAELLTDTPGALWTHDRIDVLRVREQPSTLTRIVVAVDPAVTSSKNSDATGIVACGLGENNHVYVLADASCSLSPDGWARKVVALYETIHADRVIGEVNQGGDLVETLLGTISPNLPYAAVRANRGKALRAEPVAALYEQGLVHHVGSFPELEDEMCHFSPSRPEQKSPDRMDALVWAITELKLKGSRPAIRHL